MKKFGILFGLALVSLLLQGCVTSHGSRIVERHFNESASANAVLQFSSWDYTFLVKPAYEENGFLQQVRRENIREVLDKFGVKRQMAVVVIGWTYDADELDDLASQWKTVLGGCGFQRVVLLRANGQKKLDGSLIIDDAELPIITARAETFSQF
jgi:hypothetical protein